jgi:predicted house-cleaning NTP pyrophosphatase (Maf/HAM1 superfamily)
MNGINRKNEKIPLIILASTSIYRKMLMEKLHLDFFQEAPMVDESPYQHSILDPVSLSQILARKKCLSLISKYPNHIIIGSDQVCHLGLTIFGKPKTPEKAFEHLKMLNGKTHQLTIYLDNSSSTC